MLGHTNLWSKRQGPTKELSQTCLHDQQHKLTGANLALFQSLTYGHSLPKEYMRAKTSRPHCLVVHPQDVTNSSRWKTMSWHSGTEEDNCRITEIKGSCNWGWYIQEHNQRYKMLNHWPYNKLALKIKISNGYLPLTTSLITNLFNLMFPLVSILAIWQH